MDHHHDHDQHGNSRETVLILEVLETISRQLHNIMSAITDFAAQQQVDLTTIAATLNTIVAGVAALDGIQTSVKSLVTQSAAINVTPPQVAASAAAAKA